MSTLILSLAAPMPILVLPRLFENQKNIQMLAKQAVVGGILFGENESFGNFYSGLFRGKLHGDIFLIFAFWSKNCGEYDRTIM